MVVRNPVRLWTKRKPAAALPELDGSHRTAQTAQMRRITPAAFGTVLLVAQPATALPPAPTVAQILYLCSSATVAEAAEKGSRLGWEHMDDARIAPWRSSFERGKGPVGVVGWFRGPREADGLLSFWTTPGMGGRRACSYSVGDAAGLLDGLSRELGAPGRYEANSGITAAEWAWTAGDVSFVQIGTSTLVTVPSR